MTALDIAKVRNIEKDVEYKREPLYYHPSQLSVSGGGSYKSKHKLVSITAYKALILSLLKEHMGEESASLPSHHVSVGNEYAQLQIQKEDLNYYFASLWSYTFKQ